ncbi:hypothetical protein AGMMS49975_04040 [Clostridia bacterium]|nr:hypothetical protein AGMMS49975_04040 [Clostridia bacterium]
MSTGIPNIFPYRLSYGLSESNAYQTGKWVEGTLIKDATLSLPGKKALLKSDSEYEVVLVEAKESSVDRLKRGGKNGILGKRKIKRFHIVADRHRNKRRRFGLRFNLIAGLCNFELA